MKKYYFHIQGEQHGPFDLTELKEKGISKETPVWYEGLSEWIVAGKIDELKSLFSTPPPFNSGSTDSPPPYENTKSKESLTVSPIEKKVSFATIAGSILISVAVIALVWALVESKTKHSPLGLGDLAETFESLAPAADSNMITETDTKPLINDGGAGNDIENSTPSETEDKFVGKWYDKEFGFNWVEISYSNGDYIVEFNKGSSRESSIESFKDVGRVNGNSLIINSNLKLSLINSGETILLKNEEYTRTFPKGMENLLKLGARWR